MISWCGTIWMNNSEKKTLTDCAENLGENALPRCRQHRLARLFMPEDLLAVLKNAYDSLEKQLTDTTPREEGLSILRKMRMVISDIDRELRRIKHLLLQEQDFRAVIEAGVSYKKISSF